MILLLHENLTLLNGTLQIPVRNESIGQASLPFHAI
jgi:hypothetical protein